MKVGKKAGYPETIRVDQGAEFPSRDLDLWAFQKNAMLDFSRPGMPTENPIIEAFNERFQSKCLNTHRLFLPFGDVEK